MDGFDSLEFLNLSGGRGLSPEKKEYAIIGIGNILVGDDGFGVWVVKELEKMDLPDNIEVLEVGTGAFEAIEAMRGARKAIVVDAILTGRYEPGTIFRLTLEDLEDSKLFLRMVSFHDLDLLTALKMVRDIYDDLPEDVVVIGAEAKSLETRIGLSEELEKAKWKVIEAILKEVGLDPSRYLGEKGNGN